MGADGPWPQIGEKDAQSSTPAQVLAWCRMANFFFSFGCQRFISNRIIDEQALILPTASQRRPANPISSGG